MPSSSSSSSLYNLQREDYFTNPSTFSSRKMYLTNISHNFSSLPQFRISRKQSPHKNLNRLSNSFDENLLRRLKSLALTITNENPRITLSFLSLAVDILCSTHKEAETIFSDLKYSSFDHPLNFYLDDSVKLLDICNSVSSEVNNLMHNRLLISFALNSLDSNGKVLQIPSQEKLSRAKSSLSDWLNYTSKKPNLEKAEILINKLAIRLGDPPPSGTVLTVKKLIHEIIYSVTAVTVFVAGVLVAAFSGSKMSIRIRVSSEFVWAVAFNGLQSSVFVNNGKLKRRFIDDLEDVDRRVRSVCDVIGNLAGTDRYVKESEKEKSFLLLSNAVKELQMEITEFSDSLDGLSNGVHDLFDTVLSVREGLLEKIRVGSEAA